MKKACPGFYDEKLNPGGDKTDWFVPSRDELNELWRILDQGKISDNYYWSSSEAGASYAWLQFFDGGGQDYYGKDATSYVRPVRAFG